MESYLLKEFRAWEAETGRKQTVTSFAKYLGVKQATLSRWMNGASMPEGDNLHRLAIKLGDEVYSIAGQDKPAFLSRDEFLSLLPDESAERFSKASALFSAELKKAGIKKDSPEANEIMKRSFAKFGITVKL